MYGIVSIIDPKNDIQRKEYFQYKLVFGIENDESIHQRNDRCNIVETKETIFRVKEHSRYKGSFNTNYTFGN